MRRQLAILVSAACFALAAPAFAGDRNVAWIPMCLQKTGKGLAQRFFHPSRQLLIDQLGECRDVIRAAVQAGNKTIFFTAGV